MESGPDLPKDLANKLKTSIKKSLDKAISPATRKNLQNSVKKSVERTSSLVKNTFDSTIKKAKKTGASLSAHIDSVSSGIIGEDANSRISHPKKRVPLAERLKGSKGDVGDPEVKKIDDLHKEEITPVEENGQAPYQEDEPAVSSKPNEYLEKATQKFKKGLESSKSSFKDFFVSTVGALKRGMKKDLDDDNYSQSSYKNISESDSDDMDEIDEVAEAKIADNESDNLKPKVIHSVGVYKPEKDVAELYEDLKKLSKKSEKTEKTEKIEGIERAEKDEIEIEAIAPEKAEKFIDEQIEVQNIISAPNQESDQNSQNSTPNTIVSTVSSLFSRSKTSQASIQNNINSTIYADYASLTPIDPRVKKVMFDAIDSYAANPSSLYKRGVQAKKALEDARASVANFFGANKDEIIFTSGGSETNNLVFRGVLKAFEENGSTMDSKKIIEKKIKHGEKILSVRPHFIISTIEHPSIIEIALDLINQGIDVSFVPVNQDGIVDPKDIKKALRPETILISIMYANNEIGTIQPLKEIAREVRHFKKSLGRDNLGYPYIHSDACQAVLYEDMRILSLNIDLMTIDGGKIYGPRSSGVLVKRRHVQIAPTTLGGNQELGLRAGTENVPAIIGLKHALDIAYNEKEDESARLAELREILFEMIMSKLQDKLPGISVNGNLEARLPNNLNLCFPGIDAEFLVLRLDVLGVELSSVTSCRASNEDSSSYVIEALGKSDCALSSLRISLGRFTTSVDIGHIADRIVDAVIEQSRSLKS